MGTRAVLGGSKQPALMFASRDGTVVTVADLDEGSKPDLTCLGCNHPVSARRGELRAHHFAHLPGAPDDCPARGPEGALHLAVKSWLARRFQVLNSQEFASSCPGNHKGVLPDAFLHRQGWDDVEVERRLGTRRPDLMLLEGSEPRLAIEVVVNSAVSEAKARDLEAEGVIWVEVYAQAVLSSLGAKDVDQLALIEPHFSLTVPARRWGGEEAWACPLCKTFERGSSAHGILGDVRARIARDEDRYWTKWAGSLTCQDAQGNERTVELEFGYTDNSEHEPLFGLYMGDSLFPLYQVEWTRYPDFAEVVEERDGFVAAMRDLRELLEVHGLDVGRARERPVRWTPGSMFV